MNRLLPWSATDINFTHTLRIGGNLTYKVEYICQCISLDKYQSLVEINALILNMTTCSLGAIYH